MRLKLFLPLMLLWCWAPLFGENTHPGMCPDTLVVQSQWVCESDLPFAFGGQWLTSPGTYTDTLSSAAGCDSIVQLNLIVTCCDQPVPNLGKTCEGAVLMCSGTLSVTTLDNMQATADAPGNLGSVFCYPVDNNGWLKIAVCETNLALGVSVENCSGGNPGSEGLELALMQAQNCDNFQLQGDCAVVPVLSTDTLFFENLLPGEAYYLMIDGVAGSGCSFHLDPISGVNSGIPDGFITSGSATDGYIDGPMDVCPGEMATYTVHPPGCAITVPSFNCSPPEGSCSWCGTGFEIDSFVYKWHIPYCASFVGDSTGLSVSIVFNNCVFTTDTVVVDSIWVELVPVYSDTFFHAGDTLTFCPCFCAGYSCGSVPSKSISIHYKVEHIYLVIPCAGPAPVFHGVTYGSPGTFTQYDVPACTLYFIHVSQEQATPAFIQASANAITCINPLVELQVVGNSISVCIWFTSQNVVVGTQLTVGTPGFYTAEVTDQNGCVTTAGVFIGLDVIPPPAFLGPDISICQEDTPYALSPAGVQASYIYQWNNGTTGPVNLVGQTNTYAVTVTNPVNGCSASDNIAVQVMPPKFTNLNVYGLCPGECYTVAGDIFCPSFSGQVFTTVLQSYSGCDSTVQARFFLQQPDTLDQGVAGVLTCNQPSVVYDGAVYTQPGYHVKQIDPCTYHGFFIEENFVVPPVNAGPDQSGCPGLYTLAVQNTVPGWQYVWSTGDTGPKPV
ncbi:MAG: hypothetical protein IPL65_14420 [Lewinellaceae bacterium]|nr:hypothetical protein [Lewinellaceae bacterium]